MAPLSCPLCSVSLLPASLEAHLRYELKLPAFECCLCPQRFCDKAAAERHFAGPLAQHPGEKAQLIQPPEDEAKEARLVELIRLARGGPETVQQRLCVCGQCRLLCRAEFQPTYVRELGQNESTKPTKRPTADCQPANSLGVIDRRLASEQEGMPIDTDLPTAVEEPIDQTSQHRPSHPDSDTLRPDEASMSVDVKPSLADLKPNFASDGKVACLQCGRRVDKCKFSQHVQQSHMPGKPFQCLLCPVSKTVRSKLAKHSRKQHGCELNLENHASSLSKEAVKEWISLCFGETKEIGYKSFRCRPCDKQVGVTQVKEHLSRVHLKKTIFGCKICEYAITSTGKSAMNKHVKNVHKLAPGPDTIDASGLKTYEPIIKAMIGQLMEQ